MFSKLLLFTTLISIEYLATTSKSIEFVASSWDKLNHFSAFFTLYILFSLSFANLNIKEKFLYLLFFAFQIELIQSLLPNRYFSILDIFADILGVYIAICICRFFRR